MINTIYRKLALILLGSILFVQANAQKKAPENWFNLDPKANKVYGVSTDKAYNELLKGRKSKTVIVAVIDGGTDVSHEDLKDVIWVNPKEVANNGIDDDHNGYIDDVNGWNFIGGKDSNVVEDNMEVTRVYARYNKKFANTTRAELVSNVEKEEFDLYKKAEALYLKKLNEAQRNATIYKKIGEGIRNIISYFNKEDITLDELKTYPVKSNIDNLAVINVTNAIKQKLPLKSMLAELDGAYDYFNNQLETHLNQELNTRAIVGDNYDNVNEKYYGNNRVSGPKGEHGTHVAGIIAAVRNNNIGMNGIADNVRVMVLRVVPDGDERDKDIANAIRYATDNGAKIINMSFGKSLSPNKREVDEAVRYAVSKDVLLVHAAGNDHNNIDTVENFPTARYEYGKDKAANWIEVGANTWKNKKELTAVFSNYGKNTVDVFAPGFDIYSSIPGNKYESFNGTSMAAPVVAGVAAVLRSYFPDLTAQQTKELILESAIVYKKKVYIPGSQTKTKLNEISKTGAVVNLYNAVNLAISRGYKSYN